MICVLSLALSGMAIAYNIYQYFYCRKVLKQVEKNLKGE